MPEQSNVESSEENFKHVALLEKAKNRRSAFLGRQIGRNQAAVPSKSKFGCKNFGWQGVKGYCGWIYGGMALNVNSNTSTAGDVLC